MQVEFVANASFIVRLSSGKTLLTDPWWTEGAYYGSWHNFPPINPERRAQYLQLRPDWIFISHIHPDHLDAATLAHFPRTTPILVGKFAEPGFTHLVRVIKSLGFQDVRAFELWAPTAIDGAEIAVLPQFAASASNDCAQEGDFEIDTSLWVKDADGTTLLHVIDNALHDNAAREIRQRLGRPDVAILPYAGGSFFPQGCPAYSDEKKREVRDRIGRRFLDGFVRHAGMIEARWSIPAAGSYVLGGRVAPLSEYLHQATPDEIAAAWREAGRDAGGLVQMATGDVLDTATGEVRRAEDARFRTYAVEERWAYARSLEGHTLPQDQIVVPAAFNIQWPRLLERAGRNMAQAVQHVPLDAPYDVEIEVRKRTVAGTPEGGVRHRFQVGEGDGARRFVRFGADDGLMLMVLLGAAVWNNVEIGSLMTMEREPDVQDTGIHTLMNWFRL